MADIITKPEVKPFKFDYNVNARPAVRFNDGYGTYIGSKTKDLKFEKGKFADSAFLAANMNRDDAINNFNKFIDSKPSDSLLRMDNNILIDTIKYSNAAIITNITYKFITSLDNEIKSWLYKSISKINGTYYIDINYDPIREIIDTNMNITSTELITNLNQLLYYSNENGSEYIFAGLRNYISSVMVNCMTEIYYSTIRKINDALISNSVYNYSYEIFNMINNSFEEFRFDMCFDISIYMENIFNFMGLDNPEDIDYQK